MRLVHFNSFRNDFSVKITEVADRESLRMALIWTTRRMVSKSIHLILLLMIIFIGQGHCALKEGQPSPFNIPKKNKVGICAIIRNEDSYLNEWIEYHKLIGIDHFYLYNNSSVDQSEAVLLPYIKEGLVTLIHWPDRTSLADSDEATSHWALSTQLPAYEHAAKWLSPKKVTWLLFLDIDEFLVPVHSSSLDEILEKYHEYPGIQISSDYFEAVNPLDPVVKRDLLISAVEFTGKPEQKIQTSVEKMIIKLGSQCHFTWPPYKCHFKEGIQPANASPKELRINKYLNRHRLIWDIKKKKEKIDVDSRLLSHEEKRELLEMGFAMDDKEKAIFKFIPQLRKKMGLEQPWDLEK